MRVILAALAAALSLTGACALAASPSPPPPAVSVGGPLPISAFYEDPAIFGASLSPSGKYLAAFRRDNDQVGVLIYDVAGDKSNLVQLAHSKDFHLNWIRWKGDDRLLIGVTYLDIIRVGGKPDGQIIDLKYGRFIMAMDRDGGNFAELLKSNIRNAHVFGYSLDLLDPLKADPDHILAVAPDVDGSLAVWKADVRTGVAQLVDRGDSETFAWDTDNTGAVVARAEAKGLDLIIQGRAPGETRWSEVTRVRPKDLKALADFQFLGPTASPAQLYVAVKPQSTTEGAARTIRIYDFKTRSLGPPLWPALDFDIDDIVTDDNTNALQGVCYWVDTYHCDFKDTDLQANFRGLESYFHGDRSLTPVSKSDDSHWWVFKVTGPTEPASYYLYDWRQKSLSNLGSFFPDLPAEKLGSMDRFIYKAGDGTQIHAYLTRPPGAPAGPLPLVVLPHGGPEARDNYDFDTWSQILATRGYLVLQPNFRGSGGYGVAYGEAGYGQWGARMEQDILDGVTALVKSGQADSNRICIFGASYGGYAALIGGAQSPQLYKCVVSWAGISDLAAFLKVKRGGIFVGERSPSYDYWVKSIGDPEADKAKLAGASAVTYAAAYGPPVLLIHGDSDTNVPPDQSREMERALKAAGRDVRLVMVKGEDHTDWSPEHEQAAIGQVVDFIEAHIAPAKLDPPPPAPAKTAAATTPAAAPAKTAAP